MAISSHCPHCGLVVSLGVQHDGRTGLCEHCGKQVVVPHSPRRQTPPSHSKFPAWLRITLLMFGGMVLLFGVIGPVVLSRMNTVRDHPASGRCLSNMRQVGMAMANYESRRPGAKFPASISPTMEGEFPRSWRTEMLPYLDSQGLYSAYDKRQPWNAPVNAKLHVYLELFVCPSDTDVGPLLPQTNYVVVNGESCIFNFTTSRSSVEIDHGTALEQTILLVESSRERILWPEPRDIEFEDSMATIGTPRSAISSHHPLGFNVIFADGHAKLISHTIDPKVLRAMLTYLEDD